MKAKQMMACVLAVALTFSGVFVPGSTSCAMEENQAIADSEAVSGEAVEAGEQSDDQAAEAIEDFAPGTERERYHLDYPEYPRESNRGSGSLPASYGTDRAYQTIAKNQGANGLCWCYGTNAIAEANMKKNGMGTQDFSEVHMGYATSNHGGNTVQGWDRAPYAGGNRYKSSDYLMRGTKLSGTVNESEDPCTDLENVLPDRALSITESKNQGYKARNILFLTDVFKPTLTAEINAIKAAIRDYGGVGASMYCDNENWDTYYNWDTGAYFFNRSVTYTWNGNYYPDNNHLVEIAGWDDNYSRNNFNSGCRPSGNGAWLVKSSWGPDFGDRGYIWISYEDTNFPISCFTIDGLDPYNSAETQYESDYKLEGAGWGYSGVGTAYFMKTFTVNSANQQLKAVKVFIPNASSYVSVDCIPDLDALNPYDITEDGDMGLAKEYNFSEKKGINITYPGWYTIELDDLVDLKKKGSRFAIVIKSQLSDSSRRNDIGYDHFNPIDGGPTLPSMHLIGRRRRPVRDTTISASKP
ncbi:MAG: hypothetical protein IKQ97_07200 [Eubacterium sp.]|nr:hypothetical protein [Eubacterium sp.]